MKFDHLRRLGRSLLFALAGAMAAPSVSAVVYIGSWDPVFSPSGTPFNASLGWKGEVTVIVPGNCGVSGLGTVVKDNTLSADCDSFGRAYVSGASVDFYDVSAPLIPIASLNWSFASLFDAEVINSLVVERLEFVDAVLTNIRTTTFPALAAPGALAVYDTVAGFAPDEFSLQFLLSGLNAVVPPLSGSYSGPVLLSSFIEDPCFGDCDFQFFRSEVESEAGQPRNFVFRVPEPRGIALVAAAMLMAGLAARGRRRLPK